MKKRKIFINDEFTIQFNKIRTEFSGISLTRKDLQTLMKDRFGFYLTSGLFTEMEKLHIINNAGKSGRCLLYKFSNEPIYKGKLENWYKNVRTHHNETVKNLRNKKNTQVVVIEDPIQEAIKLLKENGYKVYKPVCIWEEI